MKKLMGLMLVLASVAASAGSGQERFDGGGPIPTCYPGTPQCPNGAALEKRFFDGGGPIPTCYPGRICK